MSRVGSLRWSGLASQVNVPSLSSLATSYSTEYVRDRFAPFGVLSRARQVSQLRAPDLPRPSVDVEDRLLDRLDPSAQFEKLSRLLWRRRRLASLRGRWMYFYSELPGGGRGLVGVNVQTGRAERAVPLSDPDERFISDEAEGLLYVSRGDRMMAHPLDVRN